MIPVICALCGHVFDGKNYPCKHMFRPLITDDEIDELKRLQISAAFSQKENDQSREFNLDFLLGRFF